MAAAIHQFARGAIVLLGERRAHAYGTVGEEMREQGAGYLGGIGKLGRGDEVDADRIAVALVIVAPCETALAPTADVRCVLSLCAQSQHQAMAYLTYRTSRNRS